MVPLQNKDVSGPNKRKLMDQLPILEAKATALIKESRGWFETQEELDERVGELRKRFNTTQKKARGKSGGGGGKSKGMSKKAQLRAARGMR